MRKTVALAMILLAASFYAFAQDSEPEFSFEAGINLGTDVLPDGAGGAESWTRLGFQPDFSFGNFGIGLDLTLRFQIYPSAGQALLVYGGDWIPDYENNGKTFLDIYLPKLMYVRYGHKGDPLYAKLGSIDDFTLGDGFIVGEYANTRFLPEQRIFGLSLDVDGSLFQFPYIGAQLFTGNLARLDVAGARLFARPLYGTGIPIMENMQVGLTGVADFKADLYYPVTQPLETVAIYGMDVIVPILGGKAFPLAVFTDLVLEPKSRIGSMIGAGGRLFRFITYGAQLRVMGPGFIPVYFDANYDLYRAEKHDLMATDPTGDTFVGWFASLGFSVLEDKLAFKASLDGPFAAIPAVSTDNSTDYPHFKAIATLGEDIIGGFSFDAVYEKYFLGEVDGFFQDLVSPNDAVITAQFNYHTGAAVLSLLYNLKYDGAGGYTVTSSIQSSIKF